MDPSKFQWPLTSNFIMPTYDYTCEDSADFEVVRTINDRDAPCPCPYCGKTTQRTVLNAPNVSTLSGHVRVAHAVNEEAADNPKRLSADGPGRVGAGVGRGGTKASDGSKSFPESRPWMISR